MRSILYIGDHCILERRRIHLFHTLGFKVLSVASYLNPRTPDPSKSYLTPLNIDVDMSLLNEFKQLNPSGYNYGKTLKLNKSFVDKFDVIFFSWIYEPLFNNWNLFKNKIVIYESIGQSDAGREHNLNKLRSNGVKVVRMSKFEENFQNYCGADAIIDLEIDSNFYKGWTGTDPKLLTINSAIMRRDDVCNTNLYLQLTKDIPKKLYGSHNHDCNFDWCFGSASDSELLKQYQKSRAYFSLGTKPCPTVLSFKEAMSVGCPIVTWGPILGNHSINKTYSAYTFIENGVSGFYSDDVDELRENIKLLLNDYTLAKNMSIKSREVAKKEFSFDVLLLKWKDFFNELGLNI